MAMTKKELAEMGELKKKLAIALAFRRTEKIERDVPPPSHDAPFSTLSKGWDSHAYDGVSVWEGCSSLSSHGRGWSQTSSQNPRWLYSSKVKALKAARWELEEIYADILAAVDREIAKEESLNGPK